MHRTFSIGRAVSLVLAAAVMIVAPLAASAQDKPNIVVIWGDDIGQSNISAYTHGVMGYETPNIDRVAAEGMLFTDYYGEQSCTAGRSAFITGQSVFRTGLSKVGMPGAKEGMRPEDPTIAALLKPHGYATGQFGKNHLGDRDEMLPTNHGFDEFYGNLYHLNAEEEPELPDYPKPEDFPDFRKNFGPRGVLHSFADGQDRGHRPPDPQADGDHRRRRRRAGGGLPRPARQGGHPRSSCGSTSPTCTSAPTPSRRASARPGAGSRPTTTP